MRKDIAANRLGHRCFTIEKDVFASKISFKLDNTLFFHQVCHFSFTRIILLLLLSQERMMVTYVPQFSMSLESGHTIWELLVWLCRSSTRANGLPIWGWFSRSILEYHYDTIETSLIIPMMSSKKPTLRIVTSWLFSEYSHTKCAKNGTSCRISLSKKKMTNKVQISGA